MPEIIVEKWEQGMQDRVRVGKTPAELKQAIVVIASLFEEAAGQEVLFQSFGCVGEIGNRHTRIRERFPDVRAGGHAELIRLVSFRDHLTHSFAIPWIALGIGWSFAFAFSGTPVLATLSVVFLIRAEGRPNAPVTPSGPLLEIV